MKGGVLFVLWKILGAVEFLIFFKPIPGQISKVDTHLFSSVPHNLSNPT